MTFGEKLQNLRRQKGLSQELLAEKLHVSRQAVSKWEMNASSPDLETLLSLCKIFSVKADYLIDPEQTEPAAPSSAEPDWAQVGAKVLLAFGSVLVAAGLLAAFANWYEDQTTADILGGVIIQLVGAALIWISRALSPWMRAPAFLTPILAALFLFIPCSILCDLLASLPYFSFFPSPYPVSMRGWIFFVPLYTILVLWATRFCRKRCQSAEEKPADQGQ